MNRLNWTLIVQLSMFGLAMALGTVFVIPSKIEPMFWLVIFVICAVVIARRCATRQFLTGFMVSLVNCVWITGLHIAFVDRYLAGHPDEASMMSRMPLPDSPRAMMLMTGPVVGVVSGLLVGLFAFVASRFIKPPVV